MERVEELLTDEWNEKSISGKDWKYDTLFRLFLLESEPPRC